MKDYPLFGSQEHALIALHAAEESEVLLKNKDNILPRPQGKKLLDVYKRQVFLLIPMSIFSHSDKYT